MTVHLSCAGRGTSAPYSSLPGGRKGTVRRTTMKSDDAAERVATDGAGRLGGLPGFVAVCPAGIEPSPGHLPLTAAQKRTPGQRRVFVRLGGSSFFQRHEGVGRQPPGGVAQHIRGRRNEPVLADWTWPKERLGRERLTPAMRDSCATVGDTQERSRAVWAVRENPPA